MLRVVFRRRDERAYLGLHILDVRRNNRFHLTSHAGKGLSRLLRLLLEVDVPRMGHRLLVAVDVGFARLRGHQSLVCLLGFRDVPHV
jgi:hypothetical protein